MPDHAQLTMTVIIPTAYRFNTLIKTLEALDKQNYQPKRIIIADGAAEFQLARKLENFLGVSSLPVEHLLCNHSGAAVQRNEAAELADSDILFFLDDDVYPEPDCLAHVLNVFQEDDNQSIGAVGCILSNEEVPQPSRRAKRWYDFLADVVCDDYRGKVIGPALNFYASPDLSVQPITVEWLNSGCTAYRSLAFNQERFDSDFFKDYSFMEDLDLSVRVRRNWQLLVETKARAFHDAQTSRYKTPFKRSKMAVRNRYHVMSNTMQRISIKHHAKFIILHFVNHLVSMAKCRTISDLGTRVIEGMGFAIAFILITPKMIINCARSLVSRSKSELNNVKQ